MKVISASEANRQFSKLLRDVSHGATITVVSRGQAVANIVPAKTGTAQRNAARNKLVERLRGQKAAGKRMWSRNELYD
ncbi:MAG: type II toxin-antitoxin system prevent-host-death family antitoxin [Nitrospiraceae bacterium]|jgi:prevent-host-death family protein|nr:type II toxin-antitoxin system prevent-host-death family antitoxin [Nitrospiraceae bacterium]